MQFNSEKFEAGLTGQEMIAGMRRAPSVFRPVMDHVSENRFPPLSLLKTTIVFSDKPSLAVRRSHDLSKGPLPGPCVDTSSASRHRTRIGCLRTGDDSTRLRRQALPRGPVRGVEIPIDVPNRNLSYSGEVKYYSDFSRPAKLRHQVQPTKAKMNPMIQNEVPNRSTL